MAAPSSIIRHASSLSNPRRILINTDLDTDGHGPSSLPKPRRILIRGVNWLGDAVMTTPALHRLRGRFPQSQITMFGPEKLADLWLHHPSIDHLINFSAGESSWTVARRLRSQNFDFAIALPNSPRSALELWLARIPVRIGCARLWRNWFLTHPIQPPLTEVRMHKRSVGEIKELIRDPPSPVQRPSANASSHQIHQYLHLVSNLGASPEAVAPYLEVTSAEMEKAKATVTAEFERSGKHIGPGKPLIFFGLNPGAEYGPAKRWPAENFAAVVRKISQMRDDCCWLIFGGPSDNQLAEQIARAATGQVINLAGKTSLRQLMALLKLCRVLLTNDTGPMHVAAALGTPVVVPFGSTSPALTGPGLPGDARHHLLTSEAPCSPCFRRTCPIDFRCMTRITVERVVEEVLQAAHR